MEFLFVGSILVDTLHSLEDVWGCSSKMVEAQSRTHNIYPTPHPGGVYVVNPRLGFEMSFLNLLSLATNWLLHGWVGYSVPTRSYSIQQQGDR